MKKLVSIFLLFVSLASFAQKTDAQLNAEMNVIRDETVPKANTATRVGNALNDIVDNKVNKQNDAYLILSGTNNYTADVTPAINAYTDGFKVRVKFTNGNTGASTLNLNSLGSKSIKKSVSSDLSSGDIISGQVMVLQYDGTNFQIVGGSGFSVPGSDKQVILNNSGAFGASSQFTYDITNNRTLIGSGNTNNQGTDNFVWGLNSAINKGSWSWVFGEENSINLTSGSSGFGDNAIMSGYQNQINNTSANPFVGTFETAIGGGYDNVSNDATQGWMSGGNHNRLTLCRSCVTLGGEWGEAAGYGAFAHGLQDQAGHSITPAPTQRVLASGKNAFNFSMNNNWQTVGYGATAERSSILNTKNGNVACVGCASIGGYGLNVSSSYDSGTVAVSHLAIMRAPIIADTTGFLIGYRSSDGKAVRIHKSSLSSGLTTANNGLNVSGTTAKLGGVLTDSTTIDISKGLQFSGHTLGKGFYITNNPTSPGSGDAGIKGPVYIVTKHNGGIYLGAGDAGGGADPGNTFIQIVSDSTTGSHETDISAGDGNGNTTTLGVGASSTDVGLNFFASSGSNNTSIIANCNTDGILLSATKGVNVTGGVFHGTVSTGNIVYNVTSTSTGDDPTMLVSQNRTTSTSGTAVQLSLYNTSSLTDNVIAVTSLILARRTGGSAGTNGDGAYYRVEGLFHNVGGTLTQIGTTTTTTIAESQAGWDATYSISGTIIRAQLTGATNNNVTWHVIEAKISYLNN